MEHGPRHGRRVVHVTNDFRLNATGITDLVRSLAVAQVAAGDSVAVRCRTTDRAMVELVRPLGVQVVADSGADDTPGVLGTARLLHGADVVHVHTVRALAVAFLHAPLRVLKASASTVHNPYGRFSPLLRRLVRLPVVLASDAAGGRRVFIPNPVVGPLVAAGEGEGAGGETSLPPLAVLYVGALSERKGTDVLLSAWSRIVEAVPTATLHLVGNRDAPELEALSARLELSGSVVFHGVRQDPTPWMRAATVFVLPSRREGFPLVALQARSAGVPIVATAVDGTPDALEHGAAGVLVPSGDADRLANAVIRLLQDPAERDRLAGSAASGLDRYSVAAVAARYDEAYARLQRRRAR